MRIDSVTPSRFKSRLTELEEQFAKLEPQIHAFLPEKDRFQRLANDAAKLEAGFPILSSLPTLFGILVGVKDIFHVDGFPTHAGSRLPARALKGKQAESVTRLTNAGALIAGKTVTTEFAYFTPGPTRNPHNFEHTPGGSSSGSAAAVAAGLVDLALGTQTIGSIIRPASYCGVIGFKPSYGRVSAEGVIPLAHSLDHVGLFANDVNTIKRGASVLCNNWRATNAPKGKPYLAVLTGDYLAHASEEMRVHFERVLQRLKQAGYWIKQLDPMPDFSEVVERHNTILAVQVADAHAAWFEDYRHLYSEKMAALVEKGLSISAEELKLALAEARNFSLSISTLMDIHGIDLWISPAATGPAPKGLASTGDPVMNLPWTQAGLPTLGLPSGKNAEGLPLGIQLTADFKRDEDLLELGAAIEGVLREAT